MLCSDSRFWHNQADLGQLSKGRIDINCLLSCSLHGFLYTNEIVFFDSSQVIAALYPLHLEPSQIVKGYLGINHTCVALPNRRRKLGAANTDLSNGYQAKIPVLIEMARFTVTSSFIVAIILGLASIASASPLGLAKRECYSNSNDGCHKASNPFDNPPGGKCLGVLSVVGAPPVGPTGGTSASVEFVVYNSNGDNIACVSEVPGGSSYTMCASELEWTLEILDACGTQGATSCSTCSMNYGAWSGDCISSDGAQRKGHGVTPFTAGNAYGLDFDC